MPQASAQCLLIDGQRIAGSGAAALLTCASLLLTLHGVDPVKFDPPLAMCIPNSLLTRRCLCWYGSAASFAAAGISSFLKLGPIPLARVPAHKFRDLHSAAVD
ncbi:hypothetical protein COO60DRAFT_1459913 [Scenedesmus sp. NREL 46B-D3]|nr:hypothetical protein COO60DRAFT_1459913 [Scenedesmus sp. NREL 46B-D3]